MRQAHEIECVHSKCIGTRSRRALPLLAESEQNGRQVTRRATSVSKAKAKRRCIYQHRTVLTYLAWPRASDETVKEAFVRRAFFQSAVPFLNEDFLILSADLELR